MSDKPPFLDVEDDDQRHNRIGTLLERLNNTSPASSVPPNPLLNIGRERLPGPVKPPSALLARVKAFLPAISASNKALSQQKPEDIDIENVPQDEEQYIEMRLGLGVFETKPRPKPGPRPKSPSSEAESEPTSDSDSDATSSESESDSESSRSSTEEDSSSSSASADDDSDDSDAEPQPELPVDMKLILSRPLKPLPRAKIEV